MKKMSIGRVMALVCSFCFVAVVAYQLGREQERSARAAEQNVCELLGSLQKAGLEAPYFSYNEHKDLGEIRILSEPSALEAPAVKRVLASYSADRKYFRTWHMPPVRIVDERTDKEFREI